jgi:hypothetical protein
MQSSLHHIEICDNYIWYIKTNLFGALRHAKVNKRLTQLLINFYTAFEVIKCKIQLNCDKLNASSRLLILMNYMSRIVNKREYFKSLY